MKKKIVAFVAGASLCAGLAFTAFAATPVKLIFNGEELKSDVPAQIVEERTLVPLRVIAEMFGAAVVWDADNKTVQIDKQNTKDDNRIKLLEQALAPKAPLDAINDWAEAVKMRNGAWQFALMTEELKETRRDEFEMLNWVTGTSSPWIEKYQITEVNSTENHTYTVLFTYTDSTNSKGTYERRVIINQSENTWLISAIEDVDIKGNISSILLDDRKQLSGIFVEGENVEGQSSYDKGRLMIDDQTKIYKGNTQELLTKDVLKEGAYVEAAFHGPVMESYPVQGRVDVIRVFE